MNFECHVTVPIEHAEMATFIATKQHWKTSEIARDPVLGDKNYFYLTTHDSDMARMIARMDQATNALKLVGVPVIREKIELIIHDTKGKS